jgi:hypothetical protein
VELYLHSPNMPSWRGAQLKHRGNFTFTFFIRKIVSEGVDLIRLAQNGFQWRALVDTVMKFRVLDQLKDCYLVKKNSNCGYCGT